MSAATLDGKVALVSGALRGIGRATGECLAERGAKVWFTDLDDADAERPRRLAQTLPAATYMKLDAASEEDWQAARRRVESEDGRLDILVNNVGTQVSGKVEDISLADWQRVMRVNADSCFLGVKVFKTLLESSGALSPGGASIVNISSMMGTVGISDSGPYCASKGAVRLFTKAIAIEFAEAGVPIRANSVHPGFVDTEMLREGYTGLSEQLGVPFAELFAGAEAMVPVKRMAQPLDIARVVAFLASDDAAYMTGSEVAVDGGCTAR